MVSTFGCWGSVNNKNFIPDTVWKHVKRNAEDSRTSIPVRSRGWMSRLEGVKDFVIACTLEVSISAACWFCIGKELFGTRERFLQARVDHSRIFCWAKSWSRGCRPVRQLCWWWSENTQPSYKSASWSPRAICHSHCREWSWNSAMMPIRSKS